MEGLNVRFNVIRMAFQDDDVGGAVETGTVVATNQRGRLDLLLPTQLSLEQGLETPLMADVILRPMPRTLIVKERDQVLLVAPTAHANYNQTWRVEGQVVPTSMHALDRNHFLRFRATRIEENRTEALI
jgi:hypothetical protein